MIFLMLVADLHAQSTATLQGNISDQTGSVISGATIALQNAETFDVRTIQSDGEGFDQAAALEAGTYRLEIRAAGFQALVVDGFRVEVGTNVRRDFRLGVGAVSQSVQVTAKT